jgi:transcriptional regulator with AAA-type ATPase domain/tetratricopeptide (TPR) repeat protein
MRLEAELLGDSPRMVALREKIRRLIGLPAAAPRLPPLLLEGETGTGKGLVANVIHRTSPRRHGPFVDVNCAAIPENLLEAEMFGYERGAFTDARQAKAGLFQAAHGGTIFLDEVALLPEPLQAKLLKVLEDRTVRRLGSTRNEPTDAWVIAATNEDLAAMTRARRFREDLYHRLAVVSVALPALRDREHDVVQLAEHFLARACADYSLPRRTLAPAARAALLAYRWPGNVRELANVMERVALLSESATVTAEMLGLGPAAAAPTARVEPEAPVAAESGADEDERSLLLRVLQETDWNISRTAERLGLSRNKVRYRIEKHRLRPGGAPEATPPPAPRAAPVESVEPVAAAPVPPPLAPARLRWERRRVTMLRVTVSPTGSGDTTRLIETFVDKLQTFGGRVEELSATGIVGAFGLHPVEDAPRRAAHAAMAIQRAVARAGDLTLERSVVVGIHVAEATIGRVADAVQIDHDSKRDVVEALDALVAAGGHGVVVSGAAAPFLQRGWDLESVSPSSVAAYRLVGAEVTGLRPAAPLAGLVGRQHDLDLLERRLRSAVRGQGQVVGIVGEAGIGKSRLLLEFRQRLDRESVTCLEGSCRSYAIEIPYLPVREVLRAGCGIVDGDGPDTVADRIRTALSALDLDPDENAPFLLRLLGAERGEPLRTLDPGSIKARMLDLLRRMCVRSSRQKALVIFAEDLHWADSSSNDCLAALAEAIPGARILLVATYRPGYRPPWIEKSYATQMALQPLAREEGVAIVRAVLGPLSVPAPVLDTVLDKAEGNPFFLEELARVVRDKGDGDGPLRVPDTIEEVLRARIGWLDEEARVVLQSAAVIGKDVPVALLRQLTDLGDQAFQAAVRTLRIAEFLYEVATGGEPEYAFKHALTWEVAYGLLPAHQRRMLHARIVEVIQKLFAGRIEEHVERLAYHARGGELWEEAARYLRDAGTRAFAHSANQEAVGWFEQALAALGHVPRTEARQADAADLHIAMRNALTLLAQHERALHHLREAQALAERIGDRRRLGRALSFQANALFLMGQNDGAIAAGERARALAEELGDTALRTTTDMYVGRAHLHLGQYPRAIEIFGDIVAALGGDLAREHLGSPVLPSVFARAHLVEALSATGRFEEATRWADEATSLAESVNHPHSRFWADRAAGLARLERGETERATEALEQAHALCRTHDMPTYVPRISAELALAWALGDRLEEAVAMAEHAVEAAGMRNQAATYAAALLLLGEVARLAGRLDTAATAAGRALELFRGRRERGNEARALALVGHIAARQTPADWAGAEAHHRSACALAEELGMRPLAARTRLALARVLRQTARPGAAADEYRLACAGFGAMAMRADLAAGEAELSALR